MLDKHSKQAKINSSMVPRLIAPPRSLFCRWQVSSFELIIFTPLMILDIHIWCVTWENLSQYLLCPKRKKENEHDNEPPASCHLSFTGSAIHSASGSHARISPGLHASHRDSPGVTRIGLAWDSSAFSSPASLGLISSLYCFHPSFYLCLTMLHLCLIRISSLGFRWRPR